VKDGAITGQTTADVTVKENSFLVWKDEVEDFELSLKFRLEGGNSGIYYRVRKRPAGETKGDPLVGTQADFDASGRWTGVIMEYLLRDVLAERGQKVTIDENGAPTGEKHLLMVNPPVVNAQLGIRRLGPGFPEADDGVPADPPQLFGGHPDRAEYDLGGQQLGEVVPGARHGHDFSERLGACHPDPEHVAEHHHLAGPHLASVEPQGGRPSREVSREHHVAGLQRARLER
jgi:hypothetical protein